MNIIQGLQIQGLSLNTEENFNSIPGLWQWNDGRDRIELTSGRVTNWGDKSVQTNNFTRRTISAPYYEKNLWVYTNDSGIYLVSPRTDYTFLHNGSKFGIYTIIKPTWSLANPVGLFGPLFFAGAGGTGLQGFLTTANNNGRSGFVSRGTGVNPTRQVANLLNSASPNYTPSDTIVIQSFVNFGQTLGIKATFGNAVATQTPFYPTLAEYPQGPHSTFYCVTATAGQTLRVGMVLIYNWTGYSDALVQEFDSRVRVLLEKEKLIFQQLDI